MDYSFTDVNLPKDIEKLFYVLEQVDLDGKVTRSRVAEVLLGGRFSDMPKEFSTAVYPNPFNPATTIAYNLPEAARVNIVIYDAIGQQVRTLLSNVQTSTGRYTAQWDAKDNAGRRVASGVYFAHITAGKFVGKQKMLLLK
jgi:flagellar hook assembly protein FlgD